MVKQAHQSIIELNGQRFNAQTGRLIDGLSVPMSNQVINDLQPPIERTPLSQRGIATSKKVHKTTEPSHTLMRHAVKKPSTITDRKTVAMDVVPANPGQVAAEVFHSVSPERGQRAESIKQNALVSRFGGELRIAQASPKVVTQPNLSAKSSVTLAVSPSALVQHTASSATTKMLDKALRSANSHEQVKAKKPRLHHRVGQKLGLTARKTSVAAGGLVLLVIASFLTYQNIPNLSVKYASAKAGVNASLPTYQPSGFAINSHVSYSPGEIAVAYKANADNRSYTVTQKNTTWNSDALKDHLMSLNGDAPQTYPDNGRTIYLHDGSEADWVNNGVWYSISGDSSLNTDQLIKIATSL